MQYSYHLSTVPGEERLMEPGFALIEIPKRFRIFLEKREGEFEVSLEDRDKGFGLFKAGWMQPSPVDAAEIIEIVVAGGDCTECIQISSVVSTNCAMDSGLVMSQYLSSSTPYFS